MKARARATLLNPFRMQGIGLFTAQPVVCTLLPARAGSEILFSRVDLDDAPVAIADVQHLCRDPGALGLPHSVRTTMLQLAPDAPVATVEHLMSALAGLGVTDVLVEIEGPEIPIGDGSSRDFVDALRHAGLRTLEQTIDPIVVTEPIRVDGDHGEYIEASPAAGPEYTYELHYPGLESRIPAHSATWAGDSADYAESVAPARTFCLEEEGAAMRAMGLFTHLGPRDMLVIGENGPIDNALRFDDEPARHKLLDLIGDLALAGAPIQASIRAHRAGHALNHEMARRLRQLMTR